MSKDNAPFRKEDVRELWQRIESGGGTVEDLPALCASYRQLLDFVIETERRTPYWHCPQCGGDLVLGDSQQKLWHCSNVQISDADFMDHMEASRRYGVAPLPALVELHDRAAALVREVHSE